MIIVVASEGEGLGAAPCPSFGRCPFFVVIDEETGAVDSIANPGLDAGHGAGIEAARCVIDHSASVLCAGAIGPNAWDVCEAAGLEVLRGDGETVQEVLDRRAAGRLQVLIPGEARHAGPVP